MSLKERYRAVVNAIEDAMPSEASNPSHLGRTPKTKLIAVSKKFSSQTIREVYSFGQKDFAENYVNEFYEKFAELKDLDIAWHFIGHLQTNKVDKVVGNVELIHSVDREKLLKKIINECVKKNVKQKILLQIKFGDEPTKSGFSAEHVKPLIETYKECDQIIFSGLMCILPLEITDEQKLNYFRVLHETLASVKTELDLPNDFDELSMGMSDDFKLAIAAGSTMIRIGSAIFGVRS